MDLERHLAVLWRHRTIVAGGLLLGIVTAMLAAYQPSLGDGGPSLERRGTEEWSSSSMVLVTQKGFPEGRVTLPGLTGEGQIPGLDADQGGGAEERLDFADPTRFSSLALLYSVISYSDRVRATLPGQPSADQITATPFDPTGRGDQLLPIIQITTKGASARAAHDLNRATVAGLRKTLLQEQEANDIPDKQRVQIDVLNQPQPPVLLEGRSWTSSILAFLLCIGAAIALAHVLEGLAVFREKRAKKELAETVALAQAVAFDEPEPEPVAANGGSSEPNGRSSKRQPSGRPPSRTSRAGGSRGRKPNR